MDRLLSSVSKLSIGACICALASAAHAGQAGSGAGASADSGGTLDQVVVTAERRAIDVQQTPVSIVALTGKVLQERGVTDLNVLQYNVPSLTFQDVGNVKFLNIRGIGLSEGAPNQTTGVAVHLDGGYVAREYVYGDAFFDVADVEVLRGPQGTYEGQNASGGAIFITSTKPKLGAHDYFVNADFGTYNHRRLSAGGDMPINDQLTIRLSADAERRDSYYRNHGPYLSTPASDYSNQPGNLSRFLGRAQVLYKPNDSLEFRLIHQYSQNNTDGTPYKSFATPGSEELPSAGLWDLNYDFNSKIDIKYQRTTGVADWDANPAFRLHAVVAHQTSSQHFVADTDQTSPFANPMAPQGISDFTIQDSYSTGEVDLISKNTGRFQWTTGVNFLDYNQRNLLNFGAYNTPTNPDTSYNPETDTTLYLFLKDIRQNYAAFGEVGWFILPTLELKVGARYNYDRVGFTPASYLGFSYFAQSGIPLAPPYQIFHTWTGRVLLNWKPVDNELFYLTVSRGYKPGGTTPFGASYLSEYVLNTEAGWKATLLDRQLQISVSLFNMNYDNFQRTYSNDPFDANPATATTKNVKGTVIRGVEAQLMGRVQDFRWDISGSFTDGRYGNLTLAIPAGSFNGILPTSAALVDIKGEAVDMLPRTALNGGLAYERRMDGGVLAPELRVSYQSGYYTSFFHLPYNYVPGKTLLNFDVAYRSNAGWDLQLYANNLLDRRYIAYATGVTTAPGGYLLGAPREIGVRLNYQFR